MEKPALTLEVQGTNVVKWQGYPAARVRTQVTYSPLKWRPQGDILTSHSWCSESEQPLLHHVLLSSTLLLSISLLHHLVSTKANHPQGAPELPRYGMVNFYCCSLPATACTLQPLTECLKGNSQALDWSATLQQSFDDIKATLAAATLLAHLLPLAELSLATDTYISGVMQQKEVKE